MLRHDLRLEAPLAVPRRLQLDLAEIPFYRLRAGSVARVPTVVSRRIVLLVSQVVRQLGAHRPLDQSLRELLQQPRLANEVLGFLIILDQLVQKFFVDFHSFSLFDAENVYTDLFTPSTGSDSRYEQSRARKK